MKNVVTLILTSVFLLSACGSSQQPLSEAEQAAQYGMTVERYREEKSAAARMNMPWEEHVKMIQDNKPMDHNMDDMMDMN